jgi:hypothetical protein
MIGKTIKSLLTGSVTLTALVAAAKIYPYIMNEGTDLPAIVYVIDSLEPGYNKGGWAYDDIHFSVHSISKDYANLQLIVSAVRGALELKETGTGTQEINKIYLASMDEGYVLDNDFFYNILRFKVIINKY